ncbi:MAG: DNA repair protein RadA [Candidatus Woesebacteria bacterium]
MAKASSVYTCQNCGYESPKWMGQCPECGTWNSFVEEQKLEARRGKQGGGVTGGNSAQIIRFSDVKDFDKELPRLSTKMEEFDRVLGGGIVFGSVVLIGGEPGIGKSTLLTHLTINILTNRSNKDDSNSVKNRVLYVAGEESPEQIALRIQRMSNEKKATFSKDNLFFLTSTDVDEITATIAQEKPTLVIVDSIQTLSTQDLTGATGSIGQLKECTDRLTRTAKALHVPIFLVGHVTKEGSIAGPKVLEHMVDSVLELSGERTGQYRILRAIKNRFGATDEVGIFVHTDFGLEEVTNPSATFLEERVVGSPGSALVSVIEGTRPILIEVQALVVRSELPVPRRVARGIPVSKLQVIVAVLEKYCRLPLGTCDVFVNVAGGMTINEPAADLGIAVALASSYTNVASAKDTVYVGEVGLLGEVRKVKLLEKRIKEAKRLGFSSVVAAGTVKTVTEVTSNFTRKGR